MSSVAVPKLSGYDKILECVADKSISVRAVLLGGFADGDTVVTGLSDCDDVSSALDCIQRLGATVRTDGKITHITGAPFTPCSLYCGNSATTARLLLGLLSGINGVFTLDGDSSLRGRSMARVIEPLRAMGANITDTEGHLPIKIIGAPLHGIDYCMQTPSAQCKSAVLLAGLCASGRTTVTERVKTRDHTENMLRSMNGNVHVNGNTVRVEQSFLFGTDIDVCGDISAAVYPFIAALCIKGGRCTVKNVGLNDTRTEVLRLLRSIGARVDIIEKRGGAEPCGDVTVSGGVRLKPIILGGDDVARLIDEIPALCALACFIDGISVIEGAGALRNKESDRIRTTVAAFRALGADVEETVDGITVFGGKPLKYGVADACGDHRIAMAAAVAGAAACGATIIGGECVRVSYPDFFDEVIGCVK